MEKNDKASAIMGDIQRDEAFESVHKKLRKHEAAISVAYLKLEAKEEELSEANKALAKANKELERKDEIKDEYVLRVTHDIKGHLAAIKSSLNLLVKGTVGELTDSQKEFADIAHSRTLKLSEFVQDLLRVTEMRLSNNLDVENISLKKSVKKIIDLNSENARAKKIDLSYEYKSDHEIINANPFSIDELISNLVLNAIKYTPEQGKVKVDVDNHKDRLLTRVIDTGVGIPKDEQQMVFNEFFRASNVKSKVKDGTGLGLSLVKQIIDRHDGEIWVDSDEGKGTTIAFTLPKHIH